MADALLLVAHILDAVNQVTQDATRARFYAQCVRRRREAADEVFKKRNRLSLQLSVTETLHLSTIIQTQTSVIRFLTVTVGEGRMFPSCRA